MKYASWCRADVYVTLGITVVKGSVPHDRGSGFCHYLTWGCSTDFQHGMSVAFKRVSQRKGRPALEKRHADAQGLS